MPTKKSDVDQQLIRDLAAILNEANLTEIEVEQDNLKLRVSRLPAAVLGVGPAGPAPASAIPQPAAAAPAADPGKNAVPSPMVGTAYLASAPGVAPFIAIGQMVKEGQTLCIIEAMKTMNQIPSPRAGAVTAILFEDAEPVEFGQPLVVIE